MKKVLIFLCIAACVFVIGLFLSRKPTMETGSNLPFSNLFSSSMSNVQSQPAIAMHNNEKVLQLSGNVYSIYTISNARLKALQTTPTISLDFEYVSEGKTTPLKIESNLPIIYSEIGPKVNDKLPLESAKIGRMYNVRFLVPLNEESAKNMGKEFCVKKQAIPEIEQNACVRHFGAIGLNYAPLSTIEKLLQSGGGTLKRDQVVVTALLLQPE